jgi:hypothetical protein
MTIVRDVEENATRCACGGCPSYPGDGALFCARGKSPTKPATRGCVCTDCAVFNQYDLLGGYYCAEGPCGACGEGPQ